MTRRIAITGATGSLGRQVLKELLKREVEVVAIVRDPSRLELRSSKLTVVTMDLVSPPADFYDQLGRPDTLIYLAWGALPQYQSRLHFERELPQHYQFLRSFIERGLKHLTIPGTCLEYGMTSGELTEETPPNPTTPYGFAKDALRRQLQFLQQEHQFNLSWARLFYMTGDGQKPSALFSLLRAAVDRADEEFPMSPGDQLRDFLPMSCIAYYLVELSLLNQDTGVVNVCSGQARSVRSEVEEWLQVNQKSIRLKLGHYPYPSYEPRAFWGATKKLHELLDQHIKIEQ